MTIRTHPRIVAATLALTTVAGAAPLMSAGTARAATSSLTVFAVGDSYASGEGAIGSGWINSTCHRSALAGPQNAAGQLSALRALAFTSLACSGSVTGSSIGSGVTSTSGPFTLLGPSGQLSSVGAPGQRIDALSLSIGGNDLGFAGIVMNCMVPFNDCSLDPSVTGPLAAALGSLPARLDAVAAGIQGPGRVVPGVVQNVFVTTYPDPTTGPLGALCGTPFAPGFEGLDGVSPSEAAFASASLVAPLNAALAGMVNRANTAPGTHPVWHLVSDIPARFASHGFCTGVGSPALWAWGDPRYIATPVDSLTSQGDVFGTMHPNDQGQQQIGNALFAAERFLADRLSISVDASIPPTVGVVTNLTVHARTSNGTAAVGATVALDGVFRGVTDQAGDLSLPGITFNTQGSHQFLVDLNPYPTQPRFVVVAGNPYTIASSRNPIPLNMTTSLTMTAATAFATVPGTFTIVASTTVTLRSGVTATGVRIVPKTTSTYDPDLRQVVRETVCPTITFTPDNQAAFAPSDASQFFAC